MLIVSSFYRFVQVRDPQKLKEDIIRVREKVCVSGLILIAEEGINGTIAGTADSIDQWFGALHSDDRFEGLTHRRSFAKTDPFEGLRIRIKSGLVSLGVDGVNPNDGMGRMVSGREWNEIISSQSVILIDMRKSLEKEIGSFDGAIDMGAECFSQFPTWAKENLSDKPAVAMFCTGGIRCEKASAYLIQNGFEEVYQLEGGILHYLEELPQEEQLWRGECFVFDGRASVDSTLQPGKIELCYACSYAIRPEDREHPHYLKGGYCPRCYGRWNTKQKINFQNRLQSKQKNAFLPLKVNKNEQSP